MIVPWLLLILGIGTLILGAEGLVRGSTSLALRFGVSPLVVGLTVVSMGTSSPELVVSMKAALLGQGDIALGNAIGSNIFNIGVILGITALVCPISVHFQLIKIDTPVMIAAVLLVPVLLWDSEISQLEGAALVAAMIGYVSFNIVMARRQSDASLNREYEEGIPAQSRHPWLDVLFILAGLGLLVLGSRLLVDNAILIARVLGVTEAVIGLTIVAAGTSMPELATSVVAAFRREPDIAVGNVVGSSTFNVFGILGLSALSAPMRSSGIGVVDYAALIGLSLLALPVLWSGFKVRRIEGLLLVGCYGLYMMHFWPK